MIHGFQGTRQPAIWMGESGSVVVVPGVMETNHTYIKSTFEERGLRIVQDSEKITPAYYSVLLDDGHGGEILVEQSASTFSPRIFFYEASKFLIQPPELDISALHSQAPTRNPTSSLNPHALRSWPQHQQTFPIHMARFLSTSILTLLSMKSVVPTLNDKILSSRPLPPSHLSQISLDTTVPASQRPHYQLCRMVSSKILLSMLSPRRVKVPYYQHTFNFHRRMWSMSALERRLSRLNRLGRI